jgi:hypothetical protein
MELKTYFFAEKELRFLAEQTRPDTESKYVIAKPNCQSGSSQNRRPCNPFFFVRGSFHGSTILPFLNIFSTHTRVRVEDCRFLVSLHFGFKIQAVSWFRQISVFSLRIRSASTSDNICFQFFPELHYSYMIPQKKCHHSVCQFGLHFHI